MSSMLSLVHLKQSALTNLNEQVLTQFQIKTYLKPIKLCYNLQAKKLIEAQDLFKAEIQQQLKLIQVQSESIQLLKQVRTLWNNCEKIGIFE